MHLIVELDNDEAADLPLTLLPDHEAWRVLDATGRSVGVGQLARLGASVSSARAVATSIEVVHLDQLDDELGEGHHG